MGNFSCPFFVNKLGFQPTIIAQACWNHRLSAFTQAVICIRLFAFVCSLWHFLLSHKAAAIIWEWKGPPGMPGRGCLDRSEQHVFITGTYWFTPAHVGGNNPGYYVKQWLFLSLGDVLVSHNVDFWMLNDLFWRMTCLLRISKWTIQVT